MRIAGVWVGWGLGDHSQGDDTVQRAKGFMRRMYRSYAGHLDDTNVFDLQMESAVKEMQSRLVLRGSLTLGQFYVGVLDLPTQVAMGFKKPPNPVLPLVFTVEGHMSNMFVGPTAVVASTLEAEGRCHWKPTGYNNTKLPFDNASGYSRLLDTLSKDYIDGPPGVRWPFPAGTPWELFGFSQGGIVACEFMLRYVIPEGAPLHYRLKDFRAGVMCGNPYRELNQCAPWVPDPPKRDTQGISDKRLNSTQILLPNGRPLSDIWREHSRTKDLYAENELGEVGLNKTAVYKMVQREFTGNPASILARLWDLFTDPVDGTVDIVRSVIDGGMFVANMGPHGVYDLRPATDWARERLVAA